MGNVAKKMLLLGVLVCGCAVTSLYYGLRPEEGRQLDFSRQQLEQQAQREEAAVPGPKGGRRKKAQAAEEITVYVNGAVLYPGLYRLPKGTRAGEAITAAGGYSPQAKTERVNIARKLRDGSQVYVPFRKQGRARP